MVARNFWLKRIERALSKRTILWLSGVRRVGKTYLCQSIDGVEYFDCERPRTRQTMSDPEEFLAGLAGKTVVLDEIHRLRNPSELLKIAADHFASTRIIATGSSTLQASTKFRDTLTGRKYELWLTPINHADLSDFPNGSIEHRLENGGLPPFFLSEDALDASTDFQEWIDSYWAKDIQELFRLEQRDPFTHFLELLFINSGGIFEATSYAAPCEVSRPTISNYLRMLEDTWVAHVVRPFSSRRSHEIIKAPKVYAFDTGFVNHFRGLPSAGSGRVEQLGELWEHFVLNELHGYVARNKIRYWRDKRGHEIDFVIGDRHRRTGLTTIECKWSDSAYNSHNLRSFRGYYGEGQNYVVCANIERPYTRTFGGLKVTFIGIAAIAETLGRLSPHIQLTTM